MDDKKHIVEVAGIQMTLISNEAEEYVNGLIKLIDKRIREMVMSNKRCTKTEAALVCALDFLDEKTKYMLAMENLKQQMNAYIKDIDNLKSENDELKKMLQK